jgi:trans-2,3-dihydro-3-hydroxyanthranilate isomerase
VTSRAALSKALYNIEAFRKHLPMERTVGVHLYVAAAGAWRRVHTRMFAPLFGVPEDPATGAANVTLIGLLAHYDPRADLSLSKTIGQGFDMGGRACSTPPPRKRAEKSSPPISAAAACRC